MAMCQTQPNSNLYVSRPCGDKLSRLCLACSSTQVSVSVTWLLQADTVIVYRRYTRTQSYAGRKDLVAHTTHQAAGQGSISAAVWPASSRSARLFAPPRTALNCNRGLRDEPEILRNTFYHPQACSICVIFRHRRDSLSDDQVTTMLKDARMAAMRKPQRSVQIARGRQLWAVHVGGRAPRSENATTDLMAIVSPNCQMLRDAQTPAMGRKRLLK